MSAEKQNPGEEGPKPPADPGSIVQEVRYSNVSARVPEKVGRGVFSTGALVLQGPHEFIIDFIARLTKPHMIVARVILPASIVANVINALRDNLKNYEGKFGQPLTLPPPPPPPPGTQMVPVPIDEIYGGLKLPDEMLSGVYANAVMIVHSPGEFCFDFIANFYPRSAVSARVYLSAFQVPGFLSTLTRSFQQYQQKMAPPQNPRPPEQHPQQHPPGAN